MDFIWKFAYFCLKKACNDNNIAYVCFGKPTLSSLIDGVSGMSLIQANGRTLFDIPVEDRIHVIIRPLIRHFEGEFMGRLDTYEYMYILSYFGFDTK